VIAAPAGSSTARGSARRGSRPPEGVHADHGAHAVADLLLLRHEQLQALLQVAADEPLHRAAIGPDHLGEEILAHDRFAGVLLLRDHLQQHGACDVHAGLLLEHGEVDTVEHQAPQVGQRHVAAVDRVVQPAVRVTLDDP
jgi:hypothetical protein